VTFAAGVSVPEENRAEFQELLTKALAVDPNEDTSRRLLNLVSQRRARSLLDQIDDLFFDPLEAEEALP
jgi:predicted anti-sigma-YlaC factor YlaD